MKIEAEVKQRQRWKERYTEESEQLKIVTKELQDYKIDASDLRSRCTTAERLLQKQKDEKEMYLRLRDAVQTKYGEAMAESERIERELETKRKVLSEFEDNKKNEMVKYKKLIEEQK